MSSSNRIDQTFERLRSTHRKAFVAYLTAGDPNLAITPALVAALARAGADVIELGVPFSDPLADGIVNQLAAQRALEAGATFPKLLHTLSEIRRLTDVPLVLFTYLNPLQRRGLGTTLLEAQQAGIDGALVLDLPVEETLDGDNAFPPNFHRVQLIAPTTPAERLTTLARASSGFIYYVSRAGVTGMQSQLSTGVEAQVAAIRAVTKTPVCVGFGVSNPDQARAVASTADGVVIGSALVRQIAEWGKEKDLAQRLEDFARPFAEAIHSV